jgi:predicted transcriptional regulator
MEPKDQVLEILKAEGKPLSAGEVEKLSGLERKVVDKAFNALKKEDKIESPIRCKWQPK